MQGCLYLYLVKAETWVTYIFICSILIHIALMQNSYLMPNKNSYEVSELQKNRDGTYEVSEFTGTLLRYFLSRGIFSEDAFAETVYFHIES